MKFYLHEDTLFLILEPLMWPFSKYLPEQAGSEIMEKTPENTSEILQGKSQERKISDLQG